MPQTNTSVPLLHWIAIWIALLDRFVTNKLMKPTIRRDKLLRSYIYWLLVIGDAILAAHGLTTKGMGQEFTELIPRFLLIAALVDFGDTFDKGMRFTGIRRNLMRNAGRG